jgi:hypothetical protein
MKKKLIWMTEGQNNKNFMDLKRKKIAINSVMNM